MFSVFSVFSVLSVVNSKKAIYALIEYSSKLLSENMKDAKNFLIYFGKMSSS